MSVKREGKNELPAYERIAFAYFKKHDPILYAAALPHTGILEKRLHIRHQNQGLFQALCRSVTGQQLSTKAAASIWAKIHAHFEGKVTPEKVLASSIPELRTLGLSEAKAKTLKALAHAVFVEKLNLLALKKKSPEEATEDLIRIWGIGPWTAQMFLMFTLGAPDIFSPGDLGLVRSIEALYSVPKDSPKEVYEAIASTWSPHRSLACLILWAHRDTTQQR